MWRYILWNVGYFGCIFQVCQMLLVVIDKKSKVINDFIFGVIGGIVGIVFNIFMDVVKSCIQNIFKVVGQVFKYNWVWFVVFIVVCEEGFSVFYKGFFFKVCVMVNFCIEVLY